MNVFNITGAEGPRGPERKNDAQRAASSERTPAQGSSGKIGDSYAQSGKAEKVASLLESLKSEGETRAELVDKFKALMELGELDTPEAADRAAEAILSTRDQG